MTKLLPIIVDFRFTKHLQVFSQNDEDGAIEEVFKKIGTVDKVNISTLWKDNFVATWGFSYDQSHTLVLIRFVL